MKKKKLDDPTVASPQYAVGYEYRSCIPDGVFLRVLRRGNLTCPIVDEWFSSLRQAKSYARKKGYILKLSEVEQTSGDDACSKQLILKI